MVQSVSSQGQGRYGAINRIGMTNNGRIIYQVIDPSGQEAGKMSVAQKDCDKFERSYKDIMETAPKLQRYAQTTSPAQMEKKQKQAKWIVLGGTVLGGILPLLKIKCKGFWGFIKATGLTLLGAGAGAAGGLFVASKVATPPGAAKFTKATQTISKLDIQPFQG